MNLLALLMALLVAASASARPSDYQVNAREACRRAAAGAYLAAYDAWVLAGDSVRAADLRAGETEAALAEARGRLTAAEAEAAASSFDVALATRRDQTALEVRNLERQLAEYRGLAAASREKHATQGQREARIRSMLAGIFTFDRTGDRRDGGYPVRIDYKSACPKYRAVCALPAHEARELLALRFDDGPPPACVRYAGLSGVAPPAADQAKPPKP